MYNTTVNTISNRNSFNRSFGGYNNTYNANDNEFVDMKNMSTDRFPFLTTRKHRGNTGDGSITNIHASSRLFYTVEYEMGDETFCDAIYDKRLAGSANLTPGKKQIVSMGNYIAVWPDKKMYNVENNQWQDLTKSFDASMITFVPCDAEGTRTTSTTAPDSPSVGARYYDTSTHKIKEYTSLGWTEIETYTVIAVGSPTKPDYLPVSGGKITISGYPDDYYNKDWTIYSADPSWGLVSPTTYGLTIIAYGEMTTVPASSSAAGMKVGRTIPDMDYICSYNNRLWGCSSAEHEIYVSKLGDPSDWQSFKGISTDSYYATVGSPGDFTGCVGYNGSVLFLKEDRIHRLYGNEPSEFTLTEIHCRGLQKGSERSLSIVDERLYYKSDDAVMVYAGGLPTAISEAIEGKHYTEAVGGGYKDKYYIDMKDEDGEYWLYCYDINTGIWTKEDNIKIDWFAAIYNDLFFQEDTSGDFNVWSVGGRGSMYYDGSDNINTFTEGDFDWMVETVDLLQQYVDRKFVQKIKLRLDIPQGTTVNVDIAMDGVWKTVKTIDKAGRDTYVIPLTTATCDSFKVRIYGHGDVTILGLNVEYKEGADV